MFMQDQQNIKTGKMYSFLDHTEFPSVFVLILHLLVVLIFIYCIYKLSTG
jgi:hypothetical protein